MPENKSALKIRSTTPRKISEVKAITSGKMSVRKGIDVLLSWEAAERIWQPKSRVWYLTYAIIILFFIFVAVRLENYSMLIALVAFMMLWFMQGAMQPWIVKHMITDKGIYTQGTLFPWKEMRCFWFARKGDQVMMYIDFTKESRQPRFTLLVNEGLDEEIFEIMIQHIPYGTETEIEYNVFAKMIYGEYLLISKYIRDLDL